jgi:hypothetical protein
MFLAVYIGGGGLLFVFRSTRNSDHENSWEEIDFLALVPILSNHCFAAISFTLENQTIKLK